MNDKFKGQTPIRAELLAENEALRADLARVSAEFGLPPGIGPAPGEIARIISGLRTENERLRNRVATTDAFLYLDGGLIARLKARVASLESGYRVAINDLDQDTPRFPAVVAVLDGVVKSVEEYGAYLQYQLDGGAP